MDRRMDTRQEESKKRMRSLLGDAHEDEMRRCAGKMDGDEMRLGIETRIV